MAEPYDTARDEFLDASRQFQESLSAAFAQHSRCVATFLGTLTQIEHREATLQASVADLQESVEELKRMILDKESR